MPRREPVPQAPLAVRFQHLAAELCALAAAEGVPGVSPYAGDGAGQFARLSPEAQAGTLAYLERYAEVLRAAAAAGDRLLDDRVLLWRMIQKLGLKPHSRLFEHLPADGLIEIYDDRFVQVYRNLTFFRYCSYTLDDLLCRPFFELFRREPLVTARIVEMASRIFRQEDKGTVLYDMAPHRLEESFGKYRCMVDNRLLSPLLDDDGRAVAVVSVNRVLAFENRLPHSRAGQPRVNRLRREKELNGI